MDAFADPPCNLLQRVCMCVQHIGRFVNCLSDYKRAKCSTQLGTALGVNGAR